VFDYTVYLDFADQRRTARLRISVLQVAGQSLEPRNVEPNACEPDFRAEQVLITRPLTVPITVIRPKCLYRFAVVILMAYC
jgi:hypothetical protein